MTTKKILVSQAAPSNMAHYNAISEKFGVEIEFRPFFMIEPLTSREFRAQRINLPEYTAVVFSSRHAIDAYFALSEELRFKVPETEKYFCTTEVVAMYLQKHIVYRKRKIFYGDGTPASVMSLITAKHKGEKFLITTSDTANSSAMSRLFDEAGLDYTTAVMVKSVPENISDLDFGKYDLVALHNPYDVKSLLENFPEFKQGGTKFLTFGRSISKVMKEAGLETVFEGPTPEAPSLLKALEVYLSSL